ncbi:MAG TPA: acetylxylan esterase [bacterium]|nr:acetylxylan esterase [bacterium]
MKFHSLLLLFSLLLLAFFSISSNCALCNISIQDFYAYDSSAPLNPKLSVLEESLDYSLYRVEYDSVWGRRVPALYMVPKKCGHPNPAIVFGHGFTGKKEDMRKYLSLLSEKCYCAISIDMWYHGERNIANKKMYSKHLYQMREGLAGSVVDLRRAVDFLETRSDEVDHSRISYLGGSMGGILGALLAGVESRIKCPVLVVGGADWSYLVKNSIVVQVDLSSDGMSRSLADSARRILAPVDPINTVQLISPRPLLMINAKHDILVNPASNKKMFLRAKAPRRIVWFASGHGVPEDETMDIVIDWYDKYLRNDHVPDFYSTNEGWKTEAVNIDMSAQLPPVSDSFPLSEYLAYDRDLPLISLRDPIPSSDPFVSKFAISFQGVRDRMVSGVLNIPSQGSAPFPVAVFIHDIGDSPSNLDMLVDTLARIGYASVSIDSYQFTDKASDPLAAMSNGPFNARNLYVQTIQDNLRLIDFLEKLNTVTTSGMTFIGMGSGASIALSASFLDTRIQKVVSIETPTDLLKYNILKLYNRVTVFHSWSNESYSRNAFAPVDPLNLINSSSSASILFIRKDKSNENEFMNTLSMFRNVPGAFYVPNTSSDTTSGESDIGSALAAIASFITDAHIKEPSDSVSYLHNIAFVSINTAVEPHISSVHGSVSHTCSVSNINANLSDSLVSSLMIINARIDCATDSAKTVIAAVSSMNKHVSYIQLYDNGQNGDNAAGDNIFTGSYKIPSSDYESFNIRVGGVTNSWYPMVEKTISSAH